MSVPEFSSKQWCRICFYPLPLESDQCSHCADIQIMKQERDRRVKQATIHALGGERPFIEYTKASFMTPCFRLKQALNKCATFNSLEDNLFIWSKCNDTPFTYGNGTGKTHLAAIALRRVLEYGGTGRLVKPSQLYRELRDCETAAGERHFLRSLGELDALVIDDIDSAKDTEYTAQTLYDIIDTRYMSARGGLIVTSNVPLQDLERRWRSGRLVSRLKQMCSLIDLSGLPDRRLGK